MPKIIPMEGKRPRRRINTDIQKGQETVPITFRLNLADLRKIDEFVAGRYDPDVRTRSDILIDALYAYIGMKMVDHPEWFPAGTISAFNIQLSQFSRIRRETEITLLENELDALNKVGDVRGLLRLEQSAIDYLSYVQHECGGTGAHVHRMSTVVRRLRDINATNSWTLDNDDPVS